MATSDGRVGQLLDRLGAGRVGPDFGAELRAWVATSAPFRGFAEAHADKIRKKLGSARGPDALRDLRAELLLARLLLADRRIGLAFEAYGSGNRGPDFTATFRGEREFNLEVTRVRRRSGPLDIGIPILGKLRQLPPSVPNVLVVAVTAEAAAQIDVAGAARAMRARADRGDEAFLAATRSASPRAFYDRYLRLGAVIVWSEDAEPAHRTGLWTNRSARIAVPDRALRAVVGCLASDVR